MIRIALCDDEKTCREELRALISKWLGVSNLTADITEFADGDRLVSAAKEQPFNIIFLDILMPLVDGLETAHEIRAFDNSSKIIYLSSTRDFAFESYKVKAHSYLLKPPTYQTIAPILRECFEALERENRSLVVKVGYGHQRVALQNIEFLEAHNKHVRLALSDGSMLEASEPLYSFEDFLSGSEEFFKTHRSFIVSLPHVDHFDMKKITTKSGRSVDIARGMGKKFQDAYFTYMFRK